MSSAPYSYFVHFTELRAAEGGCTDRNGVEEGVRTALVTITEKGPDCTGKGAAGIDVDVAWDEGFSYEERLQRLTLFSLKQRRLNGSRQTPMHNLELAEVSRTKDRRFQARIMWFIMNIFTQSMVGILSHNKE